MALTSPHDILTAYSAGEIGSRQAIDMLHLDGYFSLMLAMADAGHALPRPGQDEIDQQVAGALPLLRDALIPLGTAIDDRMNIST